MTPYTQFQTHLQAEPKTWLITGVAGFIGSNLDVCQRAMSYLDSLSHQRVCRSA